MNLLNEIVFCPRLLLFDPRGQKGVREGQGGRGRPKCKAGGVAQLAGEAGAWALRKVLLLSGHRCLIQAGWATGYEPSRARATLQPWAGAQSLSIRGARHVAWHSEAPLALGSHRPRSTRSLSHTHTLQGPGSRAEEMAWAFRV